MEGIEFARICDRNGLALPRARLAGPLSTFCESPDAARDSTELVEGQKLSEFLASQESKRLSTFEALHVLYVLAKGIAPIHARGEYHGDIHDDNIMIRRQGITFEVKLLDFFDLGRPTRSKIHKDVLNLVEVFHTIVGGRARYHDQPQVVKTIIRGLKDSLILERFQSAEDIQRHLENLSW